MEPLQAGDPPYVGVYRLTGRLGSGGMGRVYAGVSPGGRKVAVKLVLPEHSADSEFRQRFAREVAAARRVGGFHTAPVVDADPAADPPWMVTAYIPGPALNEVVRTQGPLDLPALRALGAGLTEGLLAVHAAGLVHRDLKPGNIILSEDGPRIIDFGIARAADATSLTSPGVIIGTFSFMSPEQVRGEQLGPESDVFSLGSVLAFAATGHGPFDSATVPGTIHRIATEAPDLGTLPDPLHGTISACLAKNPADRPSLGSLLSILADLPGAFPPGWQPTASAPSHPLQPGPEQPTETSDGRKIPLSPTPAPGTPALGARSTAKSSREFPVKAVAIVGTSLAAALAVTLGILLATRNSTGNHLTGQQLGVSSTQTSSSGSQPAVSAASSQAAAPASGTTVCTTPAISCSGTNASALKSEPSMITDSADGAAYVEALTWTGWGTATATGTGTLQADDCNPNCAQGTDTTYAATVTLTGPVPYGDGEEAYSSMTISVPADPSRSQSFSNGLVP